MMIDEEKKSYEKQQQQQQWERPTMKMVTRLQLLPRCRFDFAVVEFDFVVDLKLLECFDDIKRRKLVVVIVVVVAVECLMKNKK